MNHLTAKTVSVILTASLLLASLQSLCAFAGYDEENTDAPYGVYGPRIDDNNVVTWDCLWFGRYCQSDTNLDGVADENDELLPIKWRVVSTQDKEALLIADRALDVKPFNSVTGNISWELSTIRSWLNGYGSGKNAAGIDFGADSFIRTAITAKEKEAILPFNYGGTIDTISLFPDELFSTNNCFGYDTVTYHEADEEYDSDRSLVAKNTDFAENRAPYRSQVKRGFEGNAWYWVRTPGEGSDQSLIRYDARYDKNDSQDAQLSFSVRPAIYLDLSKDSLYQKAGVISSDGTVKETAYSGGGSGKIGSDYIEVTSSEQVTMIVGDVAFINIPGVDPAGIKITGPGVYDAAEGRITSTGKGRINVFDGKNTRVAVIRVDQPAFKASSIELKAGKTKQLKLSGTKLKPVYSSSDPAVAFAGYTGVVSAFSPGSTVIKATIGSHSYECTVKVKTSEGGELVFSKPEGTFAKAASGESALGAAETSYMSDSDPEENAAGSAFEESADGDIEEGKWGSLSYSYDTDTETLTISGKGALKPDGGVTDFDYRSVVDKVDIKKGVTSLGEG
ncbi:MAG: hypothetical protein IKR59_06800, partial [Lachnospiraceae bacterium]|nr:hypothetical protein [Lachnospiraceae bacterium]